MVIELCPLTKAALWTRPRQGVQAVGQYKDAQATHVSCQTRASPLINRCSQNKPSHAASPCTVTGISITGLKYY